MCGFGGCGNDSFIWVILLLCLCGNNNNSNCGCGNDNSWLWILILLCCCGNNNCGGQLNNCGNCLYPQGSDSAKSGRRCTAACSLKKSVSYAKTLFFCCYLR